ncbi:uncharacterized protein C8A04DRAFT_35559 [Dichotomopilus funicola]|uniref:C2H2-type domain-containing protein n=1 Tax=Dichotomopilus funicola TaxID=1934379 RepID=A0AAN6ZP74_9PEZI|nr:hypothetical protein C8A04DRAFT_35559 [Dichotomopilus funicola]
MRPPTGSMLAPRSTPLSHGALAGAVVGSIVGALLISFCVFPFVVRARRRRHAHNDDAGLAEMGQGPGGRPVPFHTDPHDLDDNSYKRSSGSGPETAALDDGRHPADSTHHGSHPQSTKLPQGITTADQGLPSPVSLTTSPADPSFPATVPPTISQSPTGSSSSPPHDQSRSTVSRESTRGVSLGESGGRPSRELTNITTAGITEEPESLDHHSPGSEHHSHFPHLKESLRSFINRRQSSHQRRDSKRSTATATDVARSPSVLTHSDYLAQSEPEQLGASLEIDVDTPGLAWDYYHDPNLGLELADSYPQPAPDPSVPTSAPAGADFVPYEVSVTGGGAPLPAVARPALENQDAISADSGSTVSPGKFGRQQNPLPLHNQTIFGPLPRTDSLPVPIIVSDLPSPPHLQYTSAGPSGNPMEMMNPTNSTENAWMLQHQMRLIRDPQPLPQSQPELGLALELEPELALEPEPQVKLELDSLREPSPTGSGKQYNSPGAEISDYSTPPASTGHTAFNSPETRLTPFTASPSPAADLQPQPPATQNHHLMPSFGIAPGPSPPEISSPSPSPGQVSAPSPTPSAPDRSQIRPSPDGFFYCEDERCIAKDNKKGPKYENLKHRKFTTKHQFKHHRRYHDSEFKCEFPGCEMGFGTVTHLKRHENDKHYKTIRFYCQHPGCEFSRQGTRSFPRKDNRKRHMKTKHNMEPRIDKQEEEENRPIPMDLSEDLS